MDVRVGLQGKLSAEELMLLTCGGGEDSWESVGLQGDQTETVYLRLAHEPSQNPRYLVSGPNEAHVLDVSSQKEFSER